MLFVDLDHFKDINDAQGHQTGDQILIKAARRIQQSVRPTDIGRYGGDEFVVALSAPACRPWRNGVASPESAMSMPLKWMGSLDRQHRHLPTRQRMAVLQDLVAAARRGDVCQQGWAQSATRYSPPPLPV